MYTPKRVKVWFKHNPIFWKIKLFLPLTLILFLMFFHASSCGTIYTPQIAVSSSNVIKDDLAKNAFSHIVSCKAMMLLQNGNTMSFSVYVKEREWKEQYVTRKYTQLQICLCICLCMTQLKTGTNEDRMMSFLRSRIMQKLYKSLLIFQNLKYTKCLM